eukprot:TRINITY_DN13676_c0_g1_i1.p1 TRINITY_DN13676_c0_g1~~TRINITY_DN13676_c0_g1_i1.p1  ORF type:complete len:261 (+),score=24.27 TRINITY_DN13676_c0_g1_i1:35-817(+)
MDPTVDLGSPNLSQASSPLSDAIADPGSPVEQLHAEVVIEATLVTSHVVELPMCDLHCRQKDRGCCIDCVDEITVTFNGRDFLRASPFPVSYPAPTHSLEWLCPDLPGIAHVFLLAFMNSYQHLTPADFRPHASTWEFLVETIREEIDDFSRTDVYWLCYKIGATVVGYCSLDLLSDATVYLRQVAVVPTSQGVHIGRRLLVEAQQRFPRHEFVLITRHKNSDAIGFFEHEGAQPSTYMCAKYPHYTPDVYRGFEITRPL